MILAIVVGLFAVSYHVSGLLGSPSSLGLPMTMRGAGGAVVVAGLLLIAWVFRRRKPASVIVSTYITLVKLVRGSPIAEGAGRGEPLVVDGPQKYVRSPLYFGVVVMVLGWALLSAYTFVLVATVVLLLWFGLFLIPFEERELLALFGDEWKRYAERTPMLIPFSKRKPSQKS